MFVFIEGEGTANPNWLTSGNMFQNVKLFNAMAVQLEHRYFGASQPTPDVSTANLVYLRSEQALADLANFIVALKVFLGYYV